MTFRARFVAVTMLGLCSIFAAGCSSAEAEEDDESEGALEGEDQQYTFKYAFPANDLFKQPLTKAFDVAIEKHGVKLDAKITPTAKIAVGSPVVEGTATVGRRRIASALAGRPIPKILSAELKASSTYKAALDVAFDLRWSTTEPKEISREAVMREIAQELESRLNGGKGMQLATRVGEKMLGLDGPDGTRTDLPLGAYYDIVVTCGLEELEGDMSGTFTSGIEGTVVARAIYNSEGVEERRFRRDPTKKFERDLSDFKLNPQPHFAFQSIGQRVKGSCSVQPIFVVSFGENAGVRLRVEGKTAFETQASVSPSGRSWTMTAKPTVDIWGEADITIPIIHKTIDKSALLFSHEFPVINVATGGAQ